MFWKTTIPHGPPNNRVRRRGAFLDFSALLRNAHRYRLRTLSVKFLAMSYVTQVSLPSAWLYRDFTPPLDKTVCPVWYSCTALAKLGPLVANHSLGHFAGHPYSPPLSVSQLYLYRALLCMRVFIAHFSSPFLKNCFSNLVTLYESLDHIATWLDLLQWWCVGQSCKL